MNREPDAELDAKINNLTCAACADLLGIPVDEGIILDEARKLVREGYRHGSIDEQDINFAQ